MTGPKFSLRSLLIAITLIAVFLSIAMGLLGLYRSVTNPILNSYRLTETGYLLRSYLEDIGEWPHDWEDIRDYVKSHPAKFPERLSIDDLQDNIVIDFSFDPNSITDELDDATTRSPLLVVAKDGTQRGATGHPNEMVMHYLQEKRSKKESD